MVIKNTEGIQLIHLCMRFHLPTKESEFPSKDHREDRLKLFWYIFAFSGPFADLLSNHEKFRFQINDFDFERTGTQKYGIFENFQKESHEITHSISVDSVSIRVILKCF